MGFSNSRVCEKICVGIARKTATFNRFLNNFIMKPLYKFLKNTNTSELLKYMK
jgi:hypothetical protein